MITILLLACALAFALLLLWGVIQSGKREDAERAAAYAREKAEAERRRADENERELERARKQAAEAVEIHLEQIGNRDKISTGNTDTDFCGSLDVLSDLSAKRTKRTDGNS